MIATFLDIYNKFNGTKMIKKADFGRMKNLYMNDNLGLTACNASTTILPPQQSSYLKL